MNVEVAPAVESQKPVVRRLLELNAHDFSAFDGRDVNACGEYGYRYLDHYWTEPGERRAFLILCDGNIAGLALIRKGNPHTVAEFFILRKYRRQGVGRAAVARVLETWTGAWATHQVPGNSEATVFWRRAIPVNYREETDQSGTTQYFDT